MRNSLVSRLRRSATDDDGTIHIMSAVLFSVASSITALAVDIGALYSERRSLQGVADLAAMAGATSIENAEQAVEATLAANGFAAEFTVVRGHYVADPAMAPDQRFNPGATPYNAVRVHVAMPGTQYLSHGLVATPPRIEVAATAANSVHASFAVGSRLLAVRDGLANKVLGALVGMRVELTAVDYEALFASRVQAFPFLAAVAAEIGLTAGTYDEVLSARATVGQITAAALVAARAAGDGRAVEALAILERQIGAASLRVPLSRIVSLGPFGGLRVGEAPSGIDAAISALDLVNAAALAAGETQLVRLDLGTTVPGIARLSAAIAIGEPMQRSSPLAAGTPGAVARTSQLRMRLLAEIDGGSALGGRLVRLPLVVEAATAEARLAELTCGRSQDERAASIAATPSVAAISIGAVSDAALANLDAEPAVATATLIDAQLLRVRGRGHLEVGNLSETMLEFTAEDVEHRLVRRTDTRDLSRSVVSSLVERTDIEVEILGFGAGLPGTIRHAVSDLLGRVAGPLDAMLHDLVSALGIHLGEADVRVDAITCGGGALAG